MALIPTLDRLDATPEPDEIDPLALSGLTALLGFQVRMAHAAIYRDFLATLRDLNVTQKQHAVLSLIDAAPGVSQIALATILGADRATMMAIVDRLQDRDLLFRKQSKSDRRRQELYLSDAGRLFLAEARRLIDEHESRLTSRFSARELEQLHSLLTRIYADPPAG